MLKLSKSLMMTLAFLLFSTAGLFASYRCFCSKQIVGGGHVEYVWYATSASDCCDEGGNSGTETTFDEHGSAVGFQVVDNPTILNACCEFGGQ